MNIRLVILCAVLGLTAPATEVPPGQEASVPEVRAADGEVLAGRIELVFVLDTTGSMSGLIAGAKDRIWAIVNRMATAKPTPRIRIGLVAYRDRGDDYITQIVDLSDDLDAVYAQLMALQAGGGGDTPESVNQGLAEARTRMAWSDDPQAYRAMFLVGDCPPHMDYSDDVPYQQTCKAAATAGIIINTIQCGNQTATTPIWQEIARLADGSFSRVVQSGGAVAVSTPHDKDLAELSRRLEATRLYYGSVEERAVNDKRQATSTVIQEAAPMAARAERAAFNLTASGRGNLLGHQELVDAVFNDDLDLASLAEDDLPVVLQDKSPEERRAVVAELHQQRTELFEQMKAVQVKRQAWIEENAADPAGFEAEMLDSIKGQAAAKGLSMD